MLNKNKNANCYNIEKTFKYNTVVSAFSEHITIFRTLSNYIWQLKCQQRQINKWKNPEFFFWKLFRIIKFFFLILLIGTTLESKVACCTLVRPVPTLNCFPFFKSFFGNNFRDQNKNNQLFCWPAVKKILRILCVWSLKILFTN